MNSRTERRFVMGPAGRIECAIDEPQAALRGVALVCHPHPLQGGTMDNKVVQTLARGFMQLGYRAVRFNFRGIGQSEGTWDEGRGEADDALAVIADVRDASLPLAVAGFSFGAFIASQAASRLPDDAKAERLVLVGPAAQRFDVARVPDDTIVIHGEIDDVVPLQSTFDWARPQGLPVIVMPGVGHFFHGQLPRLKSLLIQNWHPAGASAA
jgi:alpha/beta superfamily hydrolase